LGLVAIKSHVSHPSFPLGYRCWRLGELVSRMLCPRKRFLPVGSTQNVRSLLHVEISTLMYSLLRYLLVSPLVFTSFKLMIIEE
jgi:hypothetical protein